MGALVVCVVAFLASCLTFFSGFGLGTLLLPAFALFYPVTQAVALTALVHFLNGLFKLLLVGRHTNLRVVLLFGLPALVASLLGAWVLLWLSEVKSQVSYTLLGREVLVAPAKVVVGVLLLLFSAAELVPRFHSLSFAPKHFPIGGILSGFFGGLAGMQGALRSAFLAKSGLSKEQFVATGAAVAFMIDISRLSVYVPAFLSERAAFDYPVLTAAVLAALMGALVGNRYLKSVTMQGIQGVVAIMLFAVAVGLISGVL
jgi:uncharacterized protein